MIALLLLAVLGTDRWSYEDFLGKHKPAVVVPTPSPEPPPAPPKPEPPTIFIRKDAHGQEWQWGNERELEMFIRGYNSALQSQTQAPAQAKPPPRAAPGPPVARPAPQASWQPPQMFLPQACRT